MKAEIHPTDELMEVVSTLHLVATHRTKTYHCAVIRSSGKQIKEVFSENQEARTCIDRLTTAVDEDVLTTQGLLIKGQPATATRAFQNFPNRIEWR